MLNEQQRIAVGLLLFVMSLLFFVGAVLSGDAQMAVTFVAGGIGALFLMKGRSRTFSAMMEEWKWAAVFVIAVLGTVLIIGVLPLSDRLRVVLYGVILAVMTILLLYHASSRRR